MEYEQLTLFPIGDNIEELANPEYLESAALNKSENGKNLITLALPSQTISREGTAERYGHGQTPHSMHVWWGRRPLSAMRAIILATLAKVELGKSRQELLNLCGAIAKFQPYPNQAIEQGRVVLGQNNSVLDLFSGGGTISLEAARLGCQAISVELNPLASFVQKTLLVYSQKVNNLPQMVEDWGKILLNQLKTDTEELWTGGANGRQPAAYFWARGISCPNCGTNLPVKPLFILKSRRKENIYARLIPVAATKSFKTEIIRGENLALSEEKNLLKCQFCSQSIEKNHLRQHHQPETILPVACCLVTTAGKQYVAYEEDKLPIQNLIAAELSLLEEELPEIELPKWSGITNPTLYGMTKHSSLFAPRQLLVLLRLLRGLRTVYHQISTRVNSDAAQAVTACLSGLIDQLVDWNCGLSVWLPTNEQVGRSLAGPGLPMQWNFVEINPLGTGPANLWDKLKRIVQAVSTIPKFAQMPVVISGTATQIDLPDACVDAIVTDPPYADNLYYSLLADCIYTWKRLGLQHIFPEDFQEPASPTASEIVASTKRQGSSDAAMSFYRNELQAALAEGYRLLKPDGILSLIFTHSTLEGWITVFSAVLGAGFHLVTAWPFCIERKARPRGMAKGAINASCVIVAAKEIGDYPKPNSQFIEMQVENLSASLAAYGWDNADIGMALFVHRTALSLRGIDNPGEIVVIIKKCYEFTRNLIPDFQLNNRKML